MIEQRRREEKPKKARDSRTTFLAVQRELAILDYELAINARELHKEKTKDDSQKKD